MLRFRDSDHLYEEINDPSRKWSGVTTLISKFKEKFDDSISEKNSRDTQSKWFGVDPAEIRRIWKAEGDRSTSLGKQYHLKQELGEVTGIQCCPVVDEWKYAGVQQLQEGVYPEFLCYHPEYAVCGQIDRVEVINNVINIIDYKSNKEIKREGFRGKRMLPPINHLQDCHLMHYSLQLSLYAYILQYHNRNMTIGNLQIHHVKFEQIGEDKYGYPIYKQENGEFVVKSVEVIPVEYLKKEVDLILNSL